MIDFVLDVVKVLIGAGTGILLADLFIVRRETKIAFRTVLQSPDVLRIKKQFGEKWDQVSPFLNWLSDHQTQEKIKRIVENTDKITQKLSLMAQPKPLNPHKSRENGE